MLNALRVTIGIIGLVCLVIGAALAYAPLGWAVAGGGLLFVAIDAGRPARPSDGDW